MFTVLSDHLPDLVDKVQYQYPHYKYYSPSLSHGIYDAKRRGDAFCLAFSGYLAG